MYEIPFFCGRRWCLVNNSWVTKILKNQQNSRKETFFSLDMKSNSIAHVFDTACSLCWYVTITLNELCFPSIKIGISFKLIHVALNDKCFHVCSLPHKPTLLISIHAKWARNISNCLKILFAHDDDKTTTTTPFNI